MNKLFATSVAAFVLLAAAPAAFAGNNDNVQVRHKVVAYGDLNLNSKPGADTLKDRLRLAAKSVCTSSFFAASISPVVEIKTYKACATAALNNAMEDVGKQMASR